jgi:FkbM family methyltransferase
MPETSAATEPSKPGLMHALAGLDSLEWPKLMPLGLTRDSFQLDEGHGIVRITRLVGGEPRAVPIALPEHAFMMAERSLRMINALQEEGARFALGADRRLQIQVAGIRCYIDGAEELFIVHEIFAQKIYRLIGARPKVVCDVGMNVGLASLFLANLPGVQAVYGFEPFEPTFQQAAANFALNPETAAKIQAFNYGLGATDKFVSAAYDYDNKGSSGTHSQLARVTSAGRSETVHIRSAAEAIARIVAAHPGVDVVAKIDCEGAEYEIFEALAASGSLSAISVFMLEWHDRGAEELLAHLTGLGFTCFAPNDPIPQPGADVTGMIYAVRSH